MHIRSIQTTYWDHTGCQWQISLFKLVFAAVSWTVCTDRTLFSLQITTILHAIKYFSSVNSWIFICSHSFDFTPIWMYNFLFNKMSKLRIFWFVDEAPRNILFLLFAGSSQEVNFAYKRLLNGILFMLSFMLETSKVFCSTSISIFNCNTSLSHLACWRLFAGIKLHLKVWHRRWIHFKRDKLEQR